MTIKSIRDGRSTKPEVDLLMKEFGDVEQDGSVISHAEIERVIDEKHGTHRYSTLVQAFRKTLFRETGIWLDGRLAIGEGYRVLLPADHLQFAKRRTKQAGRAIDLAAAVAGVLPDEKLTISQRLERDHIALHLTVVRQSISGARKALANPPKKPESVPLAAGRRRR